MIKAFNKFNSLIEAINHFGLRLKEVPTTFDQGQVDEKTFTNIASVLSNVFDVYGTFVEANEATTSVYVSRMLETVMQPICKKIKLPLQLQIAKSDGFLDIGFFGGGEFAHPVTAIIEIKATSTLRKGCAQCVAQMSSILDRNSIRGYNFDFVYGIVTNQQNWQFLKLSTKDRVIETSVVYTFPTPIAQADDHFHTYQLKQSDAKKIFEIISAIIDWSLAVTTSTTPDAFKKRMWKNDNEFNRKY